MGSSFQNQIDVLTLSRETKATGCMHTLVHRDLFQGIDLYNCGSLQSPKSDEGSMACWSLREVLLFKSKGVC
jgi:hypothetical protein